MTPRNAHTGILLIPDARWSFAMVAEVHLIQTDLTT